MAEQLSLDGEIGGSDGSVRDSSYVVGRDAMSLGERCITFRSHCDLQKLRSLLTENTVPHPEGHEPLLYCIYLHARQLKSRTTPQK